MGVNRRTLMASKIKWSKPVTKTVGKNNLPLEGRLIYTSKDGRFTIERREYVLPFKVVHYTLVDTKTGYRCEDHEKLSEAKEDAQCLVDEETTSQAS